MKNQLSIRLYGIQVGILEQLSSGKMLFRYDSDTTTPLSLNIPIRSEPYNEQICEAFFGNLLPESDVARKQIAAKYKISAHNNFALLKAIGYDCAGAISCHVLNDAGLPHDKFKLAGYPINNRDLYTHIQNLPRKPLFMDVEGLRLSLAGVQDKAAVCIIDNEIILPENGCPTTHILKPDSHLYPGLVANEYYCLKMASQLGLTIPHIELRPLEDTYYFLIERYDRKIEDNYVSRIHQIDFCQALGFPFTEKYQNEGGPGFEACFDLLKQSSHPAIDRNSLATAMVYNYFIGNMDAHAKNFSLLHIEDSEFKLAPFYDVVCTRAYDALTPKMAMKIGSQYEANRVFPRHWKELCKQIGYSYPALIRVIQKTGTALLPLLYANQKEEKELTGKSVTMDSIIQVTEPHILKTLKRFT